MKDNYIVRIKIKQNLSKGRKTINQIKSKICVNFKKTHNPIL